MKMDELFDLMNEFNLLDFQGSYFKRNGKLMKGVICFQEPFIEGIDHRSLKRDNIHLSFNKSTCKIRYNLRGKKGNKFCTLPRMIKSIEQILTDNYPVIQ